MNVLDSIPLWLFLILSVSFAAACLECGRYFGNKKRAASIGEPEAPLSAMVAAILGLLAFMMAFTFNVAVNRFDERRAAVLDEANAIGTTYLRADFLEEPDQSQVKKLLREYVKERIHGLATSNHESLMHSSVIVQKELWQVATKLARTKPSPVSALFVSSLNDMIDLHSKRVTLVLHTRVPLVVWLGLYSVALFSMLGVGYYCGMAGSKNRTESIILLFTFSIVLSLVTDLDRPAQGFIVTNQQPMVELNSSLSEDRP